ncbi:hypothetical protein SDC9_13753 [bioreactor metagenome]|uniref:Uncharacterized protein n=1 Tax=bioreactor metagenome TaxID=1076179 RepID=A0A644TMA8_9ZZZZ
MSTVLLISIISFLISLSPKTPLTKVWLIMLVVFSIFRISFLTSLRPKVPLVNMSLISIISFLISFRPKALLLRRSSMSLTSFFMSRNTKAELNTILLISIISALISLRPNLGLSSFASILAISSRIIQKIIFSLVLLLQWPSMQSITHSIFRFKSHTQAIILADSTLLQQHLKSLSRPNLHPPFRFLFY